MLGPGKPTGGVTEILLGIGEGELMSPFLTRQGLIEPLFRGVSAFSAEGLITIMRLNLHVHRDPDSLEFRLGHFHPAT